MCAVNVLGTRKVEGKEGVQWLELEIDVEDRGRITVGGKRRSEDNGEHTGGFHRSLGWGACLGAAPAGDLLVLIGLEFIHKLLLCRENMTVGEAAFDQEGRADVGELGAADFLGIDLLRGRIHGV